MTEIAQVPLNDARQVVRCFKGFDKQLACRDHQFEVGKTYAIDGDLELCGNGFHACASPLDVLAYYPAATSRYAMVDLIGDTLKSPEANADSKLCAREIRIVRELSYFELWQAHRDWFAEAIKEQAATGYRGHAAATGYRGHAAATGDSGHAAATGDSGHAAATGEHAIAAALGRFGRAKAAAGNWIVLARYDDNWKLISVRTARCGEGAGELRPDTWYTLDAKGEFVEASDKEDCR